MKTKLTKNENSTVTIEVAINSKDFKEYYPKELLNNEIETYIEPFIGGGSHFIYLIQNFTFKKVIISDINQKLINVYNQIKIKHISKNLYKIIIIYEAQIQNPILKYMIDKINELQQK
jgi:site-specific DNA-adenine methylase